jgi:hypothetical protein
MTRQLATQVDYDHDVRWMSVLSKDGKILYIDRTLPRVILNSGKSLLIVHPLMVHETTEYGLMADGMAYLPAHVRATKAEKSWVTAAGFDWAAWEAWCRGELSRLENRKITKPVPNPDVKPSPHDRRKLVSTITKS